MSTKSELEAAYRRAHYCLYLPGGAITLQVGVANAALIAWLRANGVSQWSILTAHNPGSQPRDPAENAEAQAALEVRLLERGFEPYAGENSDPDGQGPTEETCFVPGLSLKESLAIAADFHQNAFIHGAADGVAHLIWVEQGT